MLHPLGGGHAQQLKAVGQDLARRGGQAQAGQLDGHVVNQHAFGGVPGMEIRGAVAQPERDVMRRQVLGGQGHHVREFSQALHQREFGRGGQQRRIGGGHVSGRHAGVVDHRADARVGVLDVIDGVLVALGQRQVHVEHEFGVGAALDQEVAHGVAAHPVDQVAHGHVAARALGDLDLFAAAHHLDHLVQHVGRVVLRDAFVQRLQAGAHAGHGAVVVAALDVHGAVEAAFPLGLVIGHVRHEVGVTAFAFAHDAVFVVARAQFGGAQPQRAAFFVGVAAGDQRLDGGLDAARRVQRAFQVVVVELQAERLQVQVLFAAQVGHGEGADVVQAVDVAGGGDGLAVGGLEGLAGLEVARDINDVVALVAVSRPFGGIGRQAAGAGLHADGQVFDLVAGVVVIELAGRPGGRGPRAAGRWGWPTRIQPG
ncbi:hypothetical protein G6F65_015455 [Rhizopus arrhizus]|nr:hypothetical protein G6F65_015455 [Rhizopus arrhizus]